MTVQQVESIYKDTTPVIAQGSGPYLVVRCFLKEPRIDGTGSAVKHDEFFFAKLETRVAEPDPDHDPVRDGPGTKFRVKAGTDPVLAEAYEIFLAAVLKPVPKSDPQVPGPALA